MAVAPRRNNRILVPWEKGKSPVERSLLLFGCLQGLLDQPPQMPVASATPGAFDNTDSVADRRESSRQNFLRARNVRGLNRAPLANPKKAVAAAPTMRAGIQHRSLGVFKATILDANFASVRTSYRQSGPELRGYRIVGENNNVFRLLARVLERLVDQAYLLPGVEAKLIAAYDPKQRAETDLPCLENDDPLVSTNEEHSSIASC